jgi:putative hydrolase of the HAD superfamily
MRALPQAIFFDAAGTLLTVKEPVAESYARVAQAHGIIADTSRVAAGFKLAWKDTPDPLHPIGQLPADDDRSWWLTLVRKTFTHALGAPPEEGRLLAAFAELYDRFAQVDAWVLYPDVIPALEELRGRTRLLVLSNFDRRLRPLLVGLGLADYFETCIISSEVGASKPHARMFQAALTWTGLEPEQCLHVGDDSQADQAGAEAAGIPCWLVKRPGADLLDMLKAWQGV